MRNWLVNSAFVLTISGLGAFLIAQPAQPGAAGREGGPGRRADEGPPRGGGGPFALPLMTALDTDGDGAISAAEMEQAAAALKKLDQNGDGKLGPEELRPAFGGGGRGGFGEPGRGPGRPGRPGGETLIAEGPPAPKDEAEKKILDVLDDLDRNQRRGMMNVPVEDGRLLRLLAESIGARHVVEIGTSNGYSGIWLCLALGKTGGRLTTHELDARRAALARENFQRAGVEQMITLVEGDAHQTVSRLKESIDLVFVDADKEGYIDYLEKLLPLVRPGGLVVAHNMTPRQADPRYVKAVTGNPALETLFLHKEGAGVAVTLKKR